MLHYHPEIYQYTYLSTMRVLAVWFHVDKSSEAVEASVYTVYFIYIHNMKLQLIFIIYCKEGSRIWCVPNNVAGVAV